MTTRPIPEWTSSGGNIRLGPPSRWYKASSGWKKQDLISFGKVDEAYRAKHYTCPECNVRLVPHDVYEYRFICPNCEMLVGTSFGRLYAPAKPPPQKTPPP